jgi:hypothetical protein
MSFVVVALAIALRVLWVLAVPTKPVGDFAMYVESAAHLVEHGGFDSEYVYMPGYIFLIAPVQALGGGWLATKLVGAVLGGLGAGAVYGIARRMAGGSTRVALVAGLLYACWPAGIAIASVTGTDMPAAVLLIVAAYFLVRFAAERPVLAAILFGVFTGFAAYIRAIVVPLAALSVLVFRAQGRSWRASIKIHSHRVSGRLADAGSVGRAQSPALRRDLLHRQPRRADRSRGRQPQHRRLLLALAQPHVPRRDRLRPSGRAPSRRRSRVAGHGQDLDRLRSAFHRRPAASKAERLLVHERALLYWPLFRAGVLPPAHQAFFARHRASHRGRRRQLLAVRAGPGAHGLRRGLQRASSGSRFRSCLRRSPWRFCTPRSSPSRGIACPSSCCCFPCPPSRSTGSGKPARAPSPSFAPSVEA